MVGGHFRAQGLLESAGSISMEEMKVKVQEGGSQAVSVIEALLELSVSAPTLDLPSLLPTPTPCSWGYEGWTTSWALLTNLNMGGMWGNRWLFPHSLPFSLPYFPHREGPSLLFEAWGVSSILCLIVCHRATPASHLRLLSRWNPDMPYSPSPRALSWHRCRPHLRTLMSFSTVRSETLRQTGFQQRVNDS